MQANYSFMAFNWLLCTCVLPQCAHTRLSHCHTKWHVVIQQAAAAGGTRKKREQEVRVAQHTRRATP